MKLRALFFIVFLMVALPRLQAQVNPSTELQVITVDNVNDLQMVAQYGDGVFTGTAAWSPDGDTLAVGGTTGIWLYDGQNLNNPPELLPTDAQTLDLSFSPDGQTLAFFSYGAIRLYNLAERNFSLILHDTYYYVFSPDGRWLAYLKYKRVGGESYFPMSTVYLLDLQQGDEFTFLELQNQDRIQSMTFTPDSARLAISWMQEDFLTCDTEGAYTQIWDVNAGQSTQQPMTISEAQYAYFNGDGSLMVSVERYYGMGNLGRVLLWDMERNQQRFRLDSADSADEWNSVDFPVFHPTQPLVAFMIWGSPNSEVQLWNTDSGERVAQVETDGAIQGLIYSPDGASLIGVTRDGLNIWNGATLTASATVTRHGTMNNIRVNPSATEFVYNDGDGLLHFWSFEQLEQFVSTEPTALENIHFSQDSEGVAFLDEQGVVHIWHSSEETLLNGTFDHEPTFSADDTLAAYFADGQVTIWNTVSGEQRAVLAWEFGEVNVRMQFSPDNAMLLVLTEEGSQSTAAALWDTTTGELINRLSEYTGSVSSVFSPDSTHLAITNSYRMQVSENYYETRVEHRIFDLTTTRYGMFDVNFFIASSEWSYSDFSPDLSTFIFNTADWSTLDLHFMDVDTSEETFMIHNSYPGGITTYSPDGTSALIHVNSFTNCGGDYQEVTLWNIAEQRQIGYVRPGSSSFSPDGNLLAIASPNVTLWDAHTATLLTGQLGDRSRNAYSAMFSSDGRRLITIGNDGTVRVWTVQGGE